MANETPWFDSAFVTGRARKDAEWEAERRSDQRGDDSTPAGSSCAPGRRSSRPPAPSDLASVLEDREHRLRTVEGPRLDGALRPSSAGGRGQAGAIGWFARNRSAGSNARFTSRRRRYTDG